MEESKHPQEESLVNTPRCWSTLKSELPCHRSLHTGVVVGDNLYIFGGYDGVQRTNDFYKFSFRTHQWAEVAGKGYCPSPRDRHVAVAYGRSLYIHGGYDGFNRVDEFYEFNTEAGNWQVVAATRESMVPSPRHSHAAVVYRDSMFVFGGYDGVYKNDLHEYSFVDQTWRAIVPNSQWPKPRYRTTATVIKDLMLVFGGHDGSRQLNDLHAWDFASQTWTCIESIGMPPVPRDSHVAVTYKDSLYIFGGSSGTARNDFYEFRLSEKAWLPVCSNGGSPPCPRFCHIAVVHRRCAYIFGGYDGAQRLNDFCQFCFEDESADLPASTLLTDLANLVNNAELSDVVFTVEGQTVHAHKLLLCRSSYFKSMLCGRMKESACSSIDVPDITAEVFLVVLKYLYTDVADVSLQNAMSVLKAADMFCIDRLKQICEQTVLQAVTIDNAAKVLQASDEHGAQTLREATLKFIITHFDHVSKTEAFQMMARANVELVLEILNSRQ